MEEKINELLERLVEEKVECFVTESLIEEKVEKIITKLISEKVVNYLEVRSSADHYFEKKINEIVNEPIKTSDGWGHEKSYSSFEELFKQTLKNKIDGSYELSNAVKRCVEKRIDEIIKNQSNELMTKVQEQVVLELEKGIKK